MKESLIGDVFNIGGRVKELDPALRIIFDKQAERYRVYRGKHQVMTVPPHQLDQRVLVALNEGDLHRYPRLEDFIEELEAREREAERKKERELSNHVESVYLDNFDQLEDIKHFSLGGIKT